MAADLQNLRVPAEWIETTLGNVVELKRGYDLPKQDRRPGHVPLVSSSGVTDFHSEAAVPGPGVVTGRYGTLGQVFYVDGDFWPLNTTLYVRDFKGNDPRFISYWLRTIDFLAYSDKAAVPGVNRNHLHDALVSVPASLAEQQAIGHILGSLDDKVDLNRRMNETLESMAHALFLSRFFVHEAGVGAASASACQSFMSFADTVEILNGGTPKTAVPEYWGGSIPWFSVVDAPPTSDVWVLDTEKKVTQTGVDNSATQVLPVGTTIISARGTVGRLALVGVPMAMNQSCFGIRGRVGARGYYTYYATRELVSQLQQFAHGSVFSTINRATFQSVQVVVPRSEVIEEFEDLVDPMMQRIRQNLLESKSLFTLRDTLLPKLISGELRVPDAEHLVSEST